MFDQPHLTGAPAVYRRKLPTREDILQAIRSVDGYSACYELHKNLERSPWVWARAIPCRYNEPHLRRVNYCETVRPLTEEEAAEVTFLQQRGLVICRVVFVLRGNRFARLCLE
jgi:hypothetical protein